jgi:hypothetical protein
MVSAWASRARTSGDGPHAAASTAAADTTVVTNAENLRDMSGSPISGSRKSNVYI